MQVFLSWSGERSHSVAQLLAEWLPQVIQAVEPFISSTLEKGRRWNAEIAEKLTTAPVGIICLTRENVRAPWLLFESGAISKPRDGYVCTFLLDVEPADVEPPLGDFQHTRARKGDIYQLLKTINGALALKGEKPLSEGVLERVFERNWPELELRLEETARSGQRPSQPARSDRELLEEILALVRRSEVTTETWSDAALTRLGDVSTVIELARAEPRIAFVYTIRILNADLRSKALAEIERLDALVTCSEGRDPEPDIECVFLRSAEADIVEALRNADLPAQILRSRSVTWQPPRSVSS